MIDPAGWDRRYEGDADPFGVGTTWYERRKQAVLVASLPREHYGVVWDCASGTGHLAEALLDAGRCDRLVATDASARAVDLTRRRLEHHAHAMVAVSALPAVPDIAQAADLTVVPEVLYYLPAEARADTVTVLAGQPGDVVTVHWRHHPDDAWLSGADVTDELDAALTTRGKARLFRHEDTDFVLAGWASVDSSSVNDEKG